MVSNKQFWDVVKPALFDKNLHSFDHISINHKNKIVDNEVKLIDLFVLFCTMYFDSVVIIPKNIISAFVNLNCSLFILAGENNSRDIVTLFLVYRIPLPSYWHLLSCDLNFQPTVEHFQMNTFDYELWGCKHVSKLHYPVESTSKLKGKLFCRNSSKLSEPYYAVITVVPIFKQEFQGVSRNTDEYVIIRQIVLWVLYVKLNAFSCFEFPQKFWLHETTEQNAFF